MKRRYTFGSRIIHQVNLLKMKETLNSYRYCMEGEERKERESEEL